MSVVGLDPKSNSGLSTVKTWILRYVHDLHEMHVMQGYVISVELDWIPSQIPV